MTYIVRFTDPIGRLGSVGPKAINLARCHQGGLPVPAGFALSSLALDACVEHGRAGDRVRALIEELDGRVPEEVGDLPGELRGVVAALPMSSRLDAEIREAYSSLGADAVAVRSSSSFEDRANVSFAGQHDSRLNVVNEEGLVSAVRAVWASLYSDRAVHYLRTLGVSLAEIRMGVLVQSMVPADGSGVAFTIHPTTGDREQLVVSANFGLGETTVGGEATPDDATVSRTTREALSYVIGSKERVVRMRQGGGTEEAQSAAQERSRRVLSPTDLTRLTDLLLQVERLMGGDPQDVEWALTNGEFSILQARPLVASGAGGISWTSPVPGAHWRRNWRLGEWLPEPVSPLFASWMLPMLVASRENSGTGALGWEIGKSFSMPHPWFCVVNGYFYTRQDFPVMDMPRESEEERETRMTDTIAFLERWHQETLPRYVAYFEGYRSMDVDALTPAEAAALVERLVLEAGEFWGFIAPIGYAFEEMMFRPVYEQLVPEGSRPHHSVLFSGYHSQMHGAQEELFDLALRIRQHEGWRTLSRPLGAGDEVPAWLGEMVDRYNERHGHQVLSLDPLFPTFGESREHVLVNLEALLVADVVDPRERLAAAAAAREEAVAAVLGALDPGSGGWRTLEVMIRYFQANAAVREDANYYLQYGWPLLRRVLLSLARRLVARGVLDEADEIFFLEKYELEAALGEGAPAYGALARGRRRTWEARRELDAPSTLNGGGRPSRRRWDPETRSMTGIVTSPGEATGRARIVITGEDAKLFRKGEVLVIKSASPLFTPLMLMASALVVEIGGGASHSSLVARELGLPAVVNASGATESLENGQLLRVDGTTGLVIEVARSADGSE